MSAIILDGNKIAKDIRQEIATEIKSMPTKPSLAVVLVGDDPASSIYVKRKQVACEEVGIATQEINLPSDTPSHQLCGILCDLNHDSSINGILVQLPLPSHINKFDIFDTISPMKDVDVFTSFYTGLMKSGLFSILIALCSSRI